MKHITLYAAAAALLLASCTPKVPTAPVDSALFDSFTCDATPLTSDDFSSRTLDDSWWLRSADVKADAFDISTSDQPGYLRMRAHKGFFLDEDNVAMMAQPLTASDFTAETRVIFSPITKKSEAGLMFFKTEQQRLFLSLGADGVKLQNQGLTIEISEDDSPRIVEDAEQIAVAAVGNKYAFVDLKAVCKDGLMTCYYSVDGKRWKTLAKDVDTSFLKSAADEARGPKVCLTVLQ